MNKQRKQCRCHGGHDDIFVCDGGNLHFFQKLRRDTYGKGLDLQSISANVEERKGKVEDAEVGQPTEAFHERFLRGRSCAGRAGEVVCRRRPLAAALPTLCSAALATSFWIIRQRRVRQRLKHRLDPRS